MKRFVYLAGPYSSPNPIANTRTAFALAERLATECDVDVFVPHGSLLQDLVTPRPYEDWLEWDFNIISRCGDDGRDKPTALTCWSWTHHRATRCPASFDGLSGAQESAYIPSGSAQCF